VSHVPKHLIKLYRDALHGEIRVRRYRNSDFRGLQRCYRASWQSNLDCALGKNVCSIWCLILSHTCADEMRLRMLEYVTNALEKDLNDPKTHYERKGGATFVAVVGGSVVGCVCVTADAELLRMAVC
jgi:hypothetical protein